MPRKSIVAPRRSARKLADGIEDRLRQQKSDRSKRRAIEAADRLDREMEEFIKNSAPRK